MQAASHLNIINATVEHVPRVAPLFDQYRQFYNQAPDLAGCTQFLHERLARAESVVYLCALQNADAGFVQLYPIFTSVGMRRLWLLNDLFVAPAHRKQGVAQALIARCKQLAHDTHAAGLMLETGVMNHSAQALYVKEDFTRVDESLFYFWRSHSL
jgi:GNAT superfamily N-acetyltransferase